MCTLALGLMLLTFLYNATFPSIAVKEFVVTLEFSEVYCCSYFWMVDFMELVIKGHYDNFVE
jgi:hypothetical protein